MFKQSRGAPLHHYILERRIERARQMLSKRGTLAEISFALGFSSQSHFASTFHRIAGMGTGDFEPRQKANMREADNVESRT